MLNYWDPFVCSLLAGASLVELYTSSSSSISSLLTYARVRLVALSPETIWIMIFFFSKRKRVLKIAATTNNYYYILVYFMVILLRFILSSKLGQIRTQQYRWLVIYFGQFILRLPLLLYLGNLEPVSCP